MLWWIYDEGTGHDGLSNLVEELGELGFHSDIIHTFRFHFDPSY